MPLAKPVGLACLPFLEPLTLVLQIGKSITFFLAVFYVVLVHSHQQAGFGVGGRDDRCFQHHHERAAPNSSEEPLHVQPARPSQGFSR